MSSIPAEPCPNRLLLVEDDEFSNHLIELYLHKAGYTDITVATDGRQAFDIARDQQFDMIILDLNLPSMSGTEVLQRLRKEGAQEGTPILIISSLSNVDETARCLELGAEDYLPKPFNTRLLAARIDTSLEMRRLRSEVAERRAAQNQELAAIIALRRTVLSPELTAESWPRRITVAAHSVLSAAGGGDIREIFVRRDDTLFVAVGSVNQRGTVAALTAARLSAALRQAAQTAAEPHEVLAELDRALGDGGNQGSLFLAMLEPEDDHLHIANADHQPPYCLDAQPGARLLDARRGPPLGSGQPQSSELLPLDRDCRLVFRTQGMTALMKDYALRGCLEDLANASPAEIVAALRQEIPRENAPEDDATIVALGIAAR